MADATTERERYREAHSRAADAYRLAAALREARLAAEHDAADRYEEILRQAELNDDGVIRGAADEVRQQRAALRRAGGALRDVLIEMIERLVGVDTFATGFAESTDALLLLAAEGRASLVERHLAVARAEATLDRMLWPPSTDLREPGVPNGQFSSNASAHWRNADGSPPRHTQECG